MKIFRLARLARLIRALRFRAFKELKLRLGKQSECIQAGMQTIYVLAVFRIVLGVFAGLRVIGWAIVLLIAVIYAIGVVLRSWIARSKTHLIDGGKCRYSWVSEAAFLAMIPSSRLWEIAFVCRTLRKSLVQEFRTVLASMFTCPNPSVGRACRDPAGHAMSKPIVKSRPTCLPELVSSGSLVYGGHCNS